MIEIAIPYIFHDDDWQGGRNYFANLIRAVRLVAGDRVNLTLVTGHKTRTRGGRPSLTTGCGSIRRRGRGGGGGHAGRCPRPSRTCAS